MTDNIFERSETYDEDGNLNINNNFVEMDKYANITKGLGNWDINSAVTDMFNYESSTYFYTTCHEAATQTGYLTFDLYGKKTIKSIVCSFKAHLDGGAAATAVITILGSNDNSNWTSLATQTCALGTDVTGFLVSGNVKYRYIKLQLEKTVGDGAQYPSFYIYTFKILC